MPAGGVAPAPGRSGHQALRHYDRCARCVAGTGKAAGGHVRSFGGFPAKPGPDRTRGLHTPWAEPWWDAGRRAVPAGTAPHPAGCGGRPCAFRRSASFFYYWRNGKTKRQSPRTPTLGVLFLPRFRVSHVRDLRLRGENRDGGRRGLRAIHPPPVGRVARFLARGVGCVIARSEATKQTRGGSSQILDCFAPLAMTGHLPSGGRREDVRRCLKS